MHAQGNRAPLRERKGGGVVRRPKLASDSQRTFMTQSLETVRKFYEQPPVRERIMEFCGGGAGKPLSTYFLVPGNSRISMEHSPSPPDCLAEHWDKGYEINRSLWDRESLLLHLDVEYVNHDYPGEPYLDPYRTFDLQSPLENTIQGFLLEAGIVSLHLISGRGHHFIWRITPDSPAFMELESMGHLLPALRAHYSRPRPFGEMVEEPMARAHNGLGLLMEFIALEIKKRASPHIMIPVDITAQHVTPSLHGRELISIDISEYGDPLNSRFIRVPFGVYLKPSQQREIIGEEYVERLPMMIMIPALLLDHVQRLEYMTDPQRARKLAESCHTSIPVQNEGTAKLLELYQNSTLRPVHGWYYLQEPHSPSAWPQTYDQLDRGVFPCCVRKIVEHPNDLLLKPSGMKPVILTLLGMGWHPRHIAGFLTSIFERDHGWGQVWIGYVPALRADFYTRLICSQAMLDPSALATFSCEYMRRAHFCLQDDGTEHLKDYQHSILDRKRYERLASRPFNRLFLPAKHL